MKFDFDKVLERKKTESLKWRYPEWVLKEEDVIPMWVADMDFEAPPAVTEAIRRRAGHGAYGYPIISRAVWNALIQWMKVRHNWEIRREWIARSPGVVVALNLCVKAFTRPGDKIAIQSPVYHPFSYAIERNGRRILRNPLKFADGKFTMDLEDLERKIDSATKMLILCSPHNPVGRVWTRDELDALGRIAIDKNILIIADEIHEDLVFKGHTHIPFASLSEELAARTITCVAPSKTFNTPGLAMAAVIASNPDLLRTYEAESKRAGLELGTIFGIVAFEAAYTHGAEWLDELRPYLEESRNFARKYFEERIPKITFLEPEGTYLALLDCRGLGMDQRDLNEFFLKKAKVYCEPGPTFGGELAGFLRMNFGCPRSLLREALRRIENAVGDLP